MRGSISESAGSRGEAWLIVPASHTAIHQPDFQNEMYQLFHRSTGGRAGHMVGTAVGLVGIFSLIDGLVPWLGLLLVAPMSWLGARLDRLAGALTFAVGLALLGLAHALAARSGGAALWLVLGGCAIQSFSHLFEEVPPPLSGEHRFVPLGEWVRKASLGALARATLLTFGVFYWLELWATLRILPLQVMHALMALGHRPELRRALDARMAAILANPTIDWRRPSAQPDGR